MMKDRKSVKKIFSVLLAASLVVGMLPLFGGCGILSFTKPTDGGEETKLTDDTEAPYELDVVENNYAGEVDRFMDDLSGRKYEGKAVKIVTSKKSLVMPDETASTVISKDLTERNEAVENTFGIALVVEEKDPDTMLQEIKTAVRAGDYYADIVMYPQSLIGTYVAEGAVANMRSLPGFETENGYYYPSAVAAGTGGDAVYAVAGHASLNADGLSCIFFNKQLVEQAGLESPYDIVDRGEWTMDKYLEYMTAVSSLEGEYFGYGSQNTATYLTDLFFFSCGETLTSSKLGSYPVLTLGGEKTLSVIEKIKQATANEKSSGAALTAINTFDSQKTLFLVDRVDTMKTIYASKTDWGILPLPKYSAEQKNYYSLAYSEDAMFFGAVSTSADYALTADVIACINIMSYGYTKDAYVQNASYFYLRDNASIRMLSIVVENPVFDFSYSFADRYNAIPSATFMAVRNTVSGVSTLERYINMWSGQFNNSMYYLFDTEN